MKRSIVILSSDWLIFLISVGLQGGESGASPRVRCERVTAVGRREVWAQTLAPAQSHPANFALKCPRCRTSGQVGGRPLQSRQRRNTHRCIDEPDWTQEEPVVAVSAPQDSLPHSSLLLLCIEHTLLEFTLPWHFFVSFFFIFFPPLLKGPLNPSYATSIFSSWPHISLYLPVSLSLEHTEKQGLCYQATTVWTYVWLGYFSVFKHRRGLNVLFVI